MKPGRKYWPFSDCRLRQYASIGRIARSWTPRLKLRPLTLLLPARHPPQPRLGHTIRRREPKSRLAGTREASPRGRMGTRADHQGEEDMVEVDMRGGMERAAQEVTERATAGEARWAGRGKGTSSSWIYLKLKDGGAHIKRIYHWSL
jgi:hypothetical protein